MTYSYWVAQNTGFTFGKSWFNNHGPDHPWYRHRTKEDAIKDAKIAKSNLPEASHRVVHVVTTEEYIDI